MLLLLLYLLLLSIGLQTLITRLLPRLDLTINGIQTIIQHALNNY